MVGIPLAQIQEISLYRRAEAGESRTVAESMVFGAVGGFMIGVVGSFTLFNTDDPRTYSLHELPDPVDVLAIVSIGTVVGAVGLPLYDHLIHHSLGSQT